MKAEQTFCVFLFDQINLSIDGGVKFCCRACFGIEKESADEGEDADFFNIYENSFESIWEAQSFNTYRRNVLNGVPIRACIECYKQERISGNSLRKNALLSKMNAEGKHSLEDLISDYREEFEKNDSWHRWPIAFHIWGSRKCNYQCRMCSTFFSSKVAADPVQSKWRNVNHPKVITNNRLGDMKWIDSEALLYGELFKDPKSIQRINIAGGEPLIEQATVKLMKKFIDLGVAHNIELKLNTNCSVVSDQLLDYLGRFQSVELMFSIDGFGKTNEYIRHGSKWDVVHENMNRFIQLKNGRFFISPTLSAYNILEIEELIDYSMTADIPIRFGNVLRQPPYLTFHALPRNVLEVAIERWELLKVKWQDTYLETGISSIIQELTHSIDKVSDELYGTFREYNSALDKSRGENLSQGAPNLFQEIGGYSESKTYSQGLWKKLHARVLKAISVRDSTHSPSECSRER